MNEETITLSCCPECGETPKVRPGQPQIFCCGTFDLTTNALLKQWLDLGCENGHKWTMELTGFEVLP